MHAATYAIVFFEVRLPVFAFLIVLQRTVGRDINPVSAIAVVFQRDCGFRRAPARQ